MANDADLGVADSGKIKNAAAFPKEDTMNQEAMNQEAMNQEAMNQEAMNQEAMNLKLMNHMPTIRTVTVSCLNEVIPEYSLHDSDVTLLCQGNHADPFAVLGPHYVTSPHFNSNEGTTRSTLVVRCWIKDGKDVSIQLKPSDMYTLKGQCNFPMRNVSASLYDVALIVEVGGGDQMHSDSHFPVLDYELKTKYYGDPSQQEYTLIDPYQFGLLLNDFDLKLFQSGSCWHVDNLLGSHIKTIKGIKGVCFSLWAPSCRCVSVVGDWNGWDGRAHPMRNRVEYGIWELFIPGDFVGHKYGYQIFSRARKSFVKIDPYAQEFENPPATASIISGCDDAFKDPSEQFQWMDHEWMSQREKNGKQGKIGRLPMAIYEVHLPSWMRGDHNTYLGYRELADRLVKHMKLFNFTHVEFLPLAQHPFEGSWGYQVMGLYAPYSRLGTPDDFKYLVNVLHQNDIGVFLDWVPAHFCKDEWGLVCYDGEPCYEYADPREGENKNWGTKVFNFRRNEVRSFLLGSAYHWLRRYHVDGLRIDAVSSMLYKNHLRPDGEWLPNEVGGDANLEAITLLQEMNWVIHQEFPGVFTMAEESTSWEGVTEKKRGLGFDAKWDLGWMNDTLSYLCTPLPERSSKHSNLTFRGLYLAHESWILPLSHDEVVSGKGSLLDKCGFAGSPFSQRLRTLRALYGFQVSLPGRPLIFMGGEFGQGREWKESRSIDWHESEEVDRSKFCLWVQDLLAIYKDYPALHAGDDESWNFRWTDCDNAQDCIVAFLRSYMHWTNDVLVVCNFSENAYHRYPVGVPHGGKWIVLLNSDDWRYGGTMFGFGKAAELNATTGGRLGWPYCLWLDIPPFSCLLIKAPEAVNKEVSSKADNSNSELSDARSIANSD